MKIPTNKELAGCQQPSMVAVGRGQMQRKCNVTDTAKRTKGRAFASIERGRRHSRAARSGRSFRRALCLSSLAGQRIATVAHLIAHEGWNVQRTAAEEGGRAQAPTITVDASMILVDAALQRLGSTSACTREEVEEAFAWLASPTSASQLRKTAALPSATCSVSVGLCRSLHRKLGR